MHFILSLAVNYFNKNKCSNNSIVFKRNDTAINALFYTKNLLWTYKMFLFQKGQGFCTECAKCLHP